MHHLTYGKTYRLSPTHRAAVVTSLIVFVCLMGIRMFPLVKHAYGTFLLIREQEQAFDDAAENYDRLGLDGGLLYIIEGSSLKQNAIDAKVPRSVRRWLSNRVEVDSPWVKGWIALPATKGSNPGMVFFLSSISGGTSEGYFIPKASWGDLWTRRSMLTPGVVYGSWAPSSEQYSYKKSAYDLAKDRDPHSPIPRPTPETWAIYLPEVSDRNEIRFKFTLDGSEGHVAGTYNANGQMEFSAEPGKRPW